MGELLIGLVPTAIGVALSPVPVIEMILVLFSQRRVPNAIAFILTLATASAAVVALGAAGQRFGGEDGASHAMSLLVIAVGALLLGIGIKSWRNRADKSEPPIFNKIFHMGPRTAVVLGFTAVFFNPKNLVLLLTAGRTIGDSDSAQKLLLGAIFVLLSTSTFIAATVYAIVGGEAANVRLERARVWLVERNRLIVGIIFIVVGAVLMAQAVGDLV